MKIYVFLIFACILIAGIFSLNLILRKENSNNYFDGQFIKKKEIILSEEDIKSEAKLFKSKYTKQFDLMDLLNISKSLKIFVYDDPDFRKFNLDLFEGNGVEISPTDTLRFRNLNNISGNYLENFKNVVLGKVIPTTNITPFGKVPYDPNFYSTSQYVLEPWIHYRLLIHPHRVHKIEQADIAFVPFYAFLMRWAKDKQMNAVAMFHTILSMVKDRVKPHIIAYGDAGWNDRDALKEMIAVAPPNFYFVCLEEDQRGYYSPKISRVITAPYPNHIHNVGFPFLKGFTRMYQKEFLACYTGRSRYPIDILEKFIKPPNFVNHGLELPGWKTTADIGLIQGFLEYYNRCVFSIQPYGDMGTRRAFYTSLAVGTIPVIFSNNEKSYASTFRGALNIDMFTVIIPDTIQTLKNGEEQANAIINYLKGIPTNVIEKKRKYLHDHARFIQYSLVHDYDDAVSLMIASSFKLHQVLNKQP